MTNYEAVKDLAWEFIEIGKDPDKIELMITHLRYEALRKLNVQQFSEIFQRNLRGERFDDLIDELVVKGIKR